MLANTPGGQKPTVAKPDLARYIFELQHRQPELEQRRPPQNDEQRKPDLRSAVYGIGDGRERGKKPRIRISQVRTVSDLPCTRAQEGLDSSIHISPPECMPLLNVLPVAEGIVNDMDMDGIIIGQRK